MSAVIILLLVVGLVGFAIWWFFFNKDEKKETEITIKADGTITESFVPYPSQLTEYFVYETNDVSYRAPDGETITITENDPYEFLYYKSSKTDRPTIWEATFLSWERYRDCPSTDGCVKFNASNKELMEMMINDMIKHMSPFPRKYREYLVSVNLETPDKMNAKYEEYVPGGYAAFAEQLVLMETGGESDINVISKNYEFMFDILIKGFADFLNVPFPYSNEQIQRMGEIERKEILDSVHVALSDYRYQFMLLNLTLGLIYIKDNTIYTHQNPNNPGVSLLIGQDLGIPQFTFWISFIKELSGIRIKKINYEPPSELKTFKQINDSLAAKRNAQMGYS